MQNGVSGVAPAYISDEVEMPWPWLEPSALARTPADAERNRAAVVRSDVVVGAIVAVAVGEERDKQKEYYCWYDVYIAGFYFRETKMSAGYLWFS